MVWFKVDDGFYSSDKVTLIPRAQRTAAIGTWILCGTWSAHKELDGYVPAHQVEEIGGTLEGAESLVVVKLWRKRRGGFQFINWEKYQPTRADNQAKRDKDASRQAEYRSRKNAEKNGGGSDDVTTRQDRSSSLPSRPVPDPSRPDEDSSSRGNHLRLIHSRDDQSAHPVENLDALVSKVVEACADGGLTVHPLAAADIVAFIDSRRGPRAKPIQAPLRYYPGAIRDSWAEVSQFIHDRRLA